MKSIKICLIAAAPGHLVRDFDRPPGFMVAADAAKLVANLGQAIAAIAKAEGRQ